MEVLLAVGILLACAIVLGQIAGVGRKQAQKVEQLTKAQLLCQTKLNELICGATPVQAVREEKFAEAPDWRYAVELESGQEFGLARLTVSVWYQPEGEELTSNSNRVASVPTGDSATPRPGEFRLTRWIRDPSGGGDSGGRSLRERLMASDERSPSSSPGWGSGIGNLSPVSGESRRSSFGLRGLRGQPQGVWSTRAFGFGGASLGGVQSESGEDESLED